MTLHNGCTIDDIIVGLSVTVLVIQLISTNECLHKHNKTVNTVA